MGRIFFFCTFDDVFVRLEETVICKRPGISSIYSRGIPVFSYAILRFLRGQIPIDPQCDSPKQSKDGLKQRYRDV